ncbi:hypothetical protein ES703_38532 [subsurface metagenome]
MEFLVWKDAADDDGSPLQNASPVHFRIEEWNQGGFDVPVEFLVKTAPQHLQKPLVFHVEVDGLVLKPSPSVGANPPDFKGFFFQGLADLVHLKFPVVEWASSNTFVNLLAPLSVNPQQMNRAF